VISRDDGGAVLGASLKGVFTPSLLDTFEGVPGFEATMSVQKQYSKPSYFAFCPAAPLVVAGTAVYGHLDEALASQPVLEVRYSTDIMALYLVL
jgi:hypothetical protein